MCEDNGGKRKKKGKKKTDLFTHTSHEPRPVIHSCLSLFSLYISERRDKSRNVGAYAWRVAANFKCDKVIGHSETSTVDSLSSSSLSFLGPRFRFLLVVKKVYFHPSMLSFYLHLYCWCQRRDFFAWNKGASGAGARSALPFHRNFLSRSIAPSQSLSMLESMTVSTFSECLLSLQTLEIQVRGFRFY